MVAVVCGYDVHTTNKHSWWISRVEDDVVVVVVGGGGFLNTTSNYTYQSVHAMGNYSRKT